MDGERRQYRMPLDDMQSLCLLLRPMEPDRETLEKHRDCAGAFLGGAALVTLMDYAAGSEHLFMPCVIVLCAAGYYFGMVGKAPPTR